MAGTKRRHFPVVVERDEDGVFIVSIPSLQGCRSYGHTMDEALENIREAALACIDEQPEVDTEFIGVRDLEIVA